MEFNLSDHPHRRYNPLTGEWLLVSPHRTKRPWQGKVDDAPPEDLPVYDPGCYLCPGNRRASGDVNPQYETTFAFTNDFPALLLDTPDGSYTPHPLVRAEAEHGTARVLCFSPRHDLTLARMTIDEIMPVIALWQDETRSLGARGDIGYVQIFENRGAMMGASNPHPHGQIWATRRLPREVEKEDASQRAYWKTHGVDLLGDYLKYECETGERVVYANDHFAVLVPFWALWPFETLVVSRAHVGSLLDLSDAAARSLAEALHHITVCYDNLFRTSFPYSMGFHQTPTDGGEYPHWRLHIHFYPPLLRSATVQKFMVGYEMLGTPQRDITAEQAAARLRDLREVHYRARV
ncbi:MAG: UDP-glucose--hexose-1-phosphate uridylyltransferase [Anaerolineae bacterium]|nr:UDP-glucose--hexose-1-phosphate uridylyltransferase [Anaerolineae bacterium]